MQAYRLEMGTKFANKAGKDLYSFWGEQITEKLNEEIAAQKEGVLVNLASNEYFKAVKPRLLTGRVVTPVFQGLEGRTNTRSSVFYAKKARGLMCRYAIDNAITRVDDT